jgi:hypothetical protein
LRLSPGRGLCAAASLVLAGAALLAAARESVGRARVERFVTAWGLAQRRPLDVSSLRLLPAADLEATAAIEVALQAGIAPRAGEGESDGAVALAVWALHRRPGWPLHAHVLAEAAFRARPQGGAPADPKAWMTAWRVASLGAPRSDLIRRRRGEACLEAWPNLPSELRPEALDALRAAFQEPEVLEKDMPQATEILGLDGAIDLLPARPEALRTAAAIIAARALDRAADLLARADELDRRQRVSAMAALEELGRRGGSRNLAQACRSFAEVYPVDPFGGRAARLETSRLLELWPKQEGSWSTDPRAARVRFLLADPTEAATSGALARAVAGLSGVPRPIRARVLLRVGQREAAEGLRAAAVDEDPNWTDYDWDASRDALERGDLAGARAALGRLPSVDRDGCRGLILRRAIAMRAGDAVERAGVERQLDSLRSRLLAETGRSPDLSLCIEPSESDRSVVVDLALEGQALLAYGWGGKPERTLRVYPDHPLQVPIEGRWGEWTLHLTGLAGDPVTPMGAGIR